MRFFLFVSCVLLSGCAGGPSVSERGFLGESSWRHQQAIQDAAVIMQGMNRARADSQRYARLPSPPPDHAPQIPGAVQAP